ncbi:MAG: zinc-binding alcohol dehydrogenase family protein [Allomuricauda sp.]
MKYVVCEKPGNFVLKEKEVPTRKGNEALLRIKNVGICGTDIHAYGGNQAFFTYPRILGHELCAEVVEVDNNTDTIKVGDRVAIMPYLSCGTCIACTQGKTNCCSNIKVIGVHTDGGMQELISLPTNVLIPVNHLTDNETVIIEPLAIAAHAIRRASLKKGETIVVMGCGPIGIALMAQARIIGARVIAIDIDNKRLKYAMDDMGADHIINTVEENAEERVMELTNGNLCEVVFDATGAKRALEEGPKYMCHGGRYVLVGLSKGDLVYNHPQIHAKETTLLCSRNATYKDFEHVIQMIKSFPTDKYITHRMKFSELPEIFDDFIGSDDLAVKAVVDIG